jgi:hypothetical protein
MRTVFTIIPDPEYKKPPVIIRQDNPGPDTPAIVVPPDREEAKDGGVPGDKAERQYSEKKGLN